MVPAESLRRDTVKINAVTSYGRRAREFKNHEHTAAVNFRQKTTRMRSLASGLSHKVSPKKTSLSCH